MGKHYTIKRGDVFNKLTAIKPNGKDRYGKSMWLFRCECGKTKAILTTKAIQGITKSCGCIHPITKIKPGDIFHKLTAIKSISNGKENKGKWLFQCECGEKTIARPTEVKRGKRKSCGCERSLNINPGDVFHQLTAIAYIDKVNDQPRWLYKCQCGNITIANASRVKAGRTKTCGKHNKPVKSGDVFAKLTAVSYAGKNNFNHILWNYRCECGTNVVAEASVVKAGVKTHCGCETPTIRKRKNGRFIPTPEINDTKICTECAKEKPLDDFAIEKRAKIPNKRRTQCKECEHKKATIRRKKRGQKREKEYYQENRETISKKGKAYRANNKEQIRAKNRRNNKQRYKTDPTFRIRKLVSGSIRIALKSRGSKKNGATWQYLPYTPSMLRKHIEDQFEPWMNWANHGRYNSKTWDDNDPHTWTWQIDHIKPHVRFKYTSMNCKAFTECWALSNLRPLSAKQNYNEGMIEGNKNRH